VQAVGSHRFRVTFQGPGGHSWGAFGLANPHHALGRAIENFTLAADVHTGHGPRTSYSVGRIGGGTSVNSIPFESWMEVDMRSIDTTRLAGIDSIFRAAVDSALSEENEMRRDGAPLTVDVALVGDRPAGNVDVTTPLIQRAAAATRVLGGEPSASSSSTNANYPMYLGIPATTIGRGGEGANAHALTEWWRPVNEDVAVKKALLLVLAEAGLE
jgi:di/tripeptidase